MKNKKTQNAKAKKKRNAEFVSAEKFLQPPNGNKTTNKTFADARQVCCSNRSLLLCWFYLSQLFVTIIIIIFPLLYAWNNYNCIDCSTLSFFLVDVFSRVQINSNIAI